MSFPHVSARAQTHTHKVTHNAGAVPAALGGAGVELCSVAAEFEACKLEVCLHDAVT